MDREIPFEENETCDGCGCKGAYDFMGDYLCGECSRKAIEKEEIAESTLGMIEKSVENFKKGIVSKPIELDDIDIDGDDNCDYTDEINE